MLKDFFTKNEDVYNDVLNKLLVVYAFTFPIKHYANGTVFFLILVVFLIRGNFRKNFKSALQNKILIVFLGFIMLNVVWFIGTDNVHEAKIIIKNLRYSLHFLIFMTFIRTDYLVKVLYGFLVGIFVSEIMSYLIYFDLIPHSVRFYGEKVWEATPLDPSPFMNHIKYGIILSFSVSILFFNILKQKTFNIQKMISIIFFITISINMFLQGSRTGYLLYFLMIFFTITYIYSKKIIKILIPICIIFVFLFYSLYSNFSTFHNKVEQTKNSIENVIENENYNSSLGLRLASNKYSTEIIKKNFWFGVGTGDDMDALYNIAPSKDKWIFKHLSHPHSEYLHTFLQFGIFGFLFLLYLFYTIFKFKQQNDTLNFILKAGTFIMMIAMLQGCFFDDWFIIFWVLILTISSVKVEDRVSFENVFYSKNELRFYMLVTIISFLFAFTRSFKELFLDNVL